MGIGRIRTPVTGTFKPVAISPVAGVRGHGESTALWRVMKIGAAWPEHSDRAPCPLITTAEADTSRTQGPRDAALSCWVFCAHCGLRPVLSAHPDTAVEVLSPL